MPLRKRTLNPLGIAAFPDDAGKSAYAIAVSNGFTGTEAEWLASLKGADGAPGRFDLVDDEATATEQSELNPDTLYLWPVE